MIARCSIPRRMRDGPDDRTDNRKHHRDASAPPARSIPGKSRESGISGGGDTRTATAERAKGEPSEGSPFCFGAENGTRTRAARERFREFQQTPPTPGRGALRSHVPSPSCTGIQNKKGRTFWILPSCFGAENGTRTRAARERFREFQQTPPTPGRGALRSHVPGPSCTGIQKKEGRIFWILPSCFGAENGFPTQAYSSFTISALHEAFSSKVTPAMRSSCTRLHPNAFDKDNGKLHLIQAKMGMVLFFECGG